jgi:hypothetical protein
MNVKNAGQPTVGPSGPPVTNISGSVEVVGSTRHSMRGVDGRFRHRSSTQVRPLPQPSGRGGYDAVIGCRPEGWIPGARDNSVLHRDLMDDEVVHHVRPCWHNNPPISRLLDGGQYTFRRPVGG